MAIKYNIWEYYYSTLQKACHALESNVLITTIK